MWTSVALTFLSTLVDVSQQFNKKAEHTFQPCYMSKFELKNKDLDKCLKKYIGQVEEHALPIVAIQRMKDTTFVFVSATISANSIKGGLPTYITTIGKREVAVYNGGESFLKGEEKCVDNMINHLREFLLVDKINAKKGYPPGTEAIYGYDPVWAKITLVNNTVVNVTDDGVALRAIPYFKPHL
ncbi:hypothetical protein [Fibrisoma limi]|uniref:hypothetical protein n=1 Tax=Fibrisoma limi TaxID=663275 RepID=UPI001181A20E|nr:hypothetical protein [Fibrisoma limi]